MKRRNFTLMGASSIVALCAGMATPRGAKAAVSAEKAALLNTTLTPMGAERAGNADGSIPAWTGGATTIPAGWTPDQNVMPDIFADEKPMLTINAANMAQYADGLCESIKQLMTTRGFSINVYPTHRTASAPQAIYDNIAKNALTGQVNPQGARFGFSNAFGGVPFPIPDEDENKGAQIIWNHLSRWGGYNYNRKIASFTMVGGLLVQGATGPSEEHYPYYEPGGSDASTNNRLVENRSNIKAPPELYGQDLITYNYIDPLQQPPQVWELLAGQGRVRKAPELEFDTPTPGTQGIQNFDEIDGFSGSPVRYNWNCVGKKEMYIPYNNNALLLTEPSILLLPHFANPEHVRYEKHRVWVLDAVLAPGQRNVIPHRRMYIDEDTWTVALVDEYDGNGNLYKFTSVYNEVRPDVPGTILASSITQNLQADSYAVGGTPFADPLYGGPLSTTAKPPQDFNPEDMAAQAQY